MVSDIVPAYSEVRLTPDPCDELRAQLLAAQERVADLLSAVSAGAAWAADVTAWAGRTDGGLPQTLQDRADWWRLDVDPAAEHTMTPERREPMDEITPAPDHLIWTLDVPTLNYVIESLIGIWAVHPELLIDAAIADVNAIRKLLIDRARASHIEAAPETPG